MYVREPGGRLSLPLRKNFAAYEINFRVLVECALDTENPVGSGSHVIIREDYDGRTSVFDSGIARVRESLLAFKDIAHVHGPTLYERFNHLACFIFRIIVNDKDFVTDAVGILREHAFERTRQHVAPVVCADDNRDVELLTHLLKLTRVRYEPS